MMSLSLLVVVLACLHCISVVVSRPVDDDAVLSRQRRQWDSTCSFWRWSMCQGKKEVTTTSRPAEEPKLGGNPFQAKSALVAPSSSSSSLGSQLLAESEKRRTGTHPFEHNYYNGITARERILMRVLKTLWQAAERPVEITNVATTKHDHDQEQAETNSIEQINHRIDEKISTEIESSQQTIHHDDKGTEKREALLPRP